MFGIKIGRPMIGKYILNTNVVSNGTNSNRVLLTILVPDKS